MGRQKMAGAIGLPAWKIALFLKEKHIEKQGNFMKIPHIFFTPENQSSIEKIDRSIRKINMHFVCHAQREPTFHLLKNVTNFSPFQGTN
ncbi:MAG: hypothetical protein HQL52_04560 [Magnetococcales bacterium]|nr:hypothetical protein [Magnetococcales bacterium]